MFPILWSRDKGDYLRLYNKASVMSDHMSFELRAVDPFVLEKLKSTQWIKLFGLKTFHNFPKITNKSISNS